MPEARAQIIIEGIDRFSRVAKSIERGLGGLERSALALSGVGRRLTLGVTMPMAGMGVMAVKTAAKFDTALKAIQAVGGHTEEQIEELGETFIRMSTDIKTTVDSAQTLADAFYLIQGSGFAGAEAMEVLEISTKAATAGMTSTDVAARAVTATLSAYTLGAQDARRVSDVLFRTVDIGVVSFEELATSIGGVVGSAAAAGVSIEEVGAAIATMTKAGYSGAESVTSLNMVIAAFLKPCEDMEEALRRLGYESGEAFLRTEGLEGALRLLRGEVEEGTVGWEDLFRNVRAYRGVVALTRGEMQPFRADLEAIRSATEGAGATQKTFNKMVESAEFQMKSLRRQFEAATLELGRALLPAFKDTLSTLTPLIKSFADLDEGTKSFIVRAGLLGAAVGPVAVGLSKVIEASRTLSTIFGKVTGKAFEKTKALSEQASAEEAAWKSAVTLTRDLSGLGTVMGGLGVGAAALALSLGLTTVATKKLSEEIKEQEEIARKTAKTYEDYLAQLGFTTEGLKLLRENALGATSSQNSLLISMILTREEFEKQQIALSDTREKVWELREAWIRGHEKLQAFRGALEHQTAETLPAFSSAVWQTKEAFLRDFGEMGTAHDEAFSSMKQDLEEYEASFETAASDIVSHIEGIDSRLSAFREKSAREYDLMMIAMGAFDAKFKTIRNHLVEEQVPDVEAAFGSLQATSSRVFGLMSQDVYAVQFATRELGSAIHALPKVTHLEIRHNFGDAAGAAYGVKAAVEAIPSTKTVTIYTRHIGLYPMERGGIVPGPPGRPVPILAHGGELVLPRDVTRLLLEERVLRPTRLPREIHFHYEPTFSFATALEMRNAARELYRLIREEERRFA